MPYIAQEKRAYAQSRFGYFGRTDVIVEEQKNQAGCLELLHFRPLERGLEDKRVISYRNINELIGVLECAKLELYRRVASPYEDEKIQSNGDVFNEC